MDTKIKALILLLFSAFTTFAQTPGINFAAKFNITSATGGDPYNITGIVLDDLSRFTGSDVQVNDSIYVIDGDQLYVLAVTSITSVVGPTVTLVANDPNNAGVSIPTGQAAICRPTDNYKLPLYISGLRDDLRSMVMNRQAQLIDDINGSAVSAITDFTSAGVNVPPSPAASLNGGETWRNMTTGELWGSDGNVWYPYTRGPKECQDTVLVSAITVQSGGSVTTGSPLIRNSSGVWEHMYNHPSGLNLVPDGVVTDIVTGGKAIIQYCGVRKGSGATPNTSYYVNQSISTGFTTTKPTTNIRPLGKVASNGDFLINAGLLFSRDNYPSISLSEIVFGTGTSVTSSKKITVVDKTVNSIQYKSLTVGDSAVTSDKVLGNIIIKNKYSVPGTGILRGSSATVYTIKNPSNTTENSDFTEIMESSTNQSYPGAPGSGGTAPPDSTRDNVWKYGFNVNGVEKPSQFGMWLAMENNWYNGGQLWQELHLGECYNPYFATAPFIAVYGNKSSFRLATTEVQNVKNPLLTTNVWNFVSDGLNVSSLKSRAQYFKTAYNESTGTAQITAWGGRSSISGMSINIDTINNIHSLLRQGAFSPSTSRFSVTGYNRFSWANDLGTTVFDYNRSANSFLFGATGIRNSFYFQANNYNSGDGLLVSGDLTNSTYQNRGHIWLYNASFSRNWHMGYRTDADFAYMTQDGGTTAFSGSFKKYTFGTNVGGAYPKGSAYFNIYTDVANTTPVILYSTNTDSIKAFVTSVNPNTVITGRVGDITYGTNGNHYIKKTGANTNTGWEQAVTTSGTSTSISTMMREESFTATAAQTAFTIAYSAPAVSGTSVPIRVYRNGVRLFYVASGPTITQFTYSGTTVTTAANTVGDIITIEYLN